MRRPWCASALLGAFTAACSYDLPGFGTEPLPEICGDHFVVGAEECDEDSVLPEVCEQCRRYLLIEKPFSGSVKILEPTEFELGADQPRLSEMACFALKLDEYESDNGISEAQSELYKYVVDVDVEVGAYHPSVGELVVLVNVPGAPVAYAPAMRRPGMPEEGLTDGLSREDGGAAAKINSQYPLSFHTCTPDDPKDEGCAGWKSAEEVGSGLTEAQAVCLADDVCDWQASAGDGPGGLTLADLNSNVLWIDGVRHANVWRVCVQDTVDNESGGVLRNAKIRIRRRKTSE